MSLCNIRGNRPLIKHLRWWKSMMIVNQINLIKFQRLSNIYIHNIRTRYILFFLDMIIRIYFKIISIINIINIVLTFLSTILFTVRLKFQSILISLLTVISMVFLEFRLVFLKTLLFVIRELFLAACIGIVRICIFLIAEHINNLIIIILIYKLFHKIIR